MSKDRVTIGAVARHAQVAVSTVSRVLNGGSASSEARARVEQAVKELGFRPSPTAQSLRRGRAGSLGVIVESSQSTWFAQLLGGIEEELEGRPFSVLLGSLALRGRHDMRTVRAWIDERRVDGLVFVRTGQRERGLVQAAREAQVPMVFVCPDELPADSTVVRCDNLGGAAAVAHHLVDLGHEHVWFVGGPWASLDTRERLTGLRQGLAAGDVELRPEDVSFAASYHPPDALGAAARWHDQERALAPTAVVLGSDGLALGFMRALQQQGVRVPRDVSVVGFDGVPEGALCWPGLTTMEQPIRQMGHMACRDLLDQLDNDHEGPRQLHEFPMVLTIRESTGTATRRRVL